jgi:ubiquitin carboxyl-terminal hydrolase 6/32
LGEDELVYCSKCKEHQRALKTLQLWKLPPILVSYPSELIPLNLFPYLQIQIIHLKRFQFHNGRWVKSQKIVKFPTQKFDPANYIVKRERRVHKANTESSGSTSGVENDDSSPEGFNGAKCSGDEGIGKGSYSVFQPSPLLCLAL